MSTDVHRRPFVFLDRDGTIIEERHYLCDPDQVVLCAGAAEGLKRLQRTGFRLVAVTNQSGIARGYYTETQFHAVNHRMQDLLQKHQVTLDAIYWCPHSPGANCECRKPKAGMVRRAVSELGGDLLGAYVIGDKNCDLELGRSLGLNTILVRTGYGRTTETELARTEIPVVENIEEAAELILGRSSPEPLP